MIQTIHLSETERQQLDQMLTRGRWSVRERRRAEILLFADREPTMTNDALKERVGCGRETARRTRARYLHGGLAAALTEAPRSGHPTATTVADDAFVVATACSTVPLGHEHWSLNLLLNRLNRHRANQDRAPVSQGPIIRILLTHDLKPWREKNVGDSGSHAGVPRPHAGRPQTVRAAT